MAAALEPAYIRQMGIAHVHGPAQPAADVDQRCNGLAFSDTGAALVSSHKDGTISLFDGNTGKREASYLCRETGCKLVTFTHSNYGVLHASDSRSAASMINYHDLHSNRVVRTFKGHAGKITSLSMNPGFNGGPDVFLSCCTAGSFMLWDLRQSQPVGSGSFPMPDKPQYAPAHEPPYPAASFDATGRIFCVLTPQRGLAFYDTVQLSGASLNWSQVTQRPLFAFTSQVQKAPQQAEAAVLPPYPALMSYTGLEFSPDDKPPQGTGREGKLLAIGTADRGAMLIDAFTPTKEYALLNQHPVDLLHPCNISWSPDGRWLTVGGIDGHVYCYDGATNKPQLPGTVETGFPWRHPPVWEPGCVMVGEAHKSPAALTTATEASKAFRQRTIDGMNETRKRVAESRKVAIETLGAPRTLPVGQPMYAASPEEQVSRHEAPVTFVRWHPNRAVLATAARNVAIWTPPAST